MVSGANSNVAGSIPKIIRNEENRYDGNLIHYFRALFFHAQNLTHPYHNFHHMTHVLWLCYEACCFYEKQLSRRQVRNLLIATLFHDFNHSGQVGNDDLNVENAVRGLKKYLEAEDQESFGHIVTLIRATEYPYPVSLRQLELSAMILRDADLSQALNVAWIQQVVFGLAAEWKKPPLEVLKVQGAFHKSITFQTQWAQQKFPREVIEQKIAEARELLIILE